MSPHFRKVHHPPLLPNYRPISITSVLSKVFERLVSVHLGRFMARSIVLPTIQFAYRKGLGTCDALLMVSHTLQSALESGRRLGSCRLISVQNLIGPTIWVFSISSALWVLEVLFCLYLHSFYQTDHRSLWWMVVGVNWLTLYQECRRAVFWAPVLFVLCTSELFSILENKLICYSTDHFTSCLAIPRL